MTVKFDWKGRGEREGKTTSKEPGPDSNPDHCGKGTINSTLW